MQGSADAQADGAVADDSEMDGEVAHGNAFLDDGLEMAGVADADEDADYFLHGAVAYARISGVQNKSLDGAPGQVVGFCSSSQRWQVSLFGDPVVKKVKRCNLVPYSSSVHDICRECGHQFDLCAVPQCHCGLSDDDDDSSCPCSEQGGVSS